MTATITPAKFSLGNAKLKKTAGKVKAHIAKHGTLAGHMVPGRRYRVASFNLPAGGYTDPDTGVSHIVCPGAAGCLSLCYARQGTFRFPGSVRVRVNAHRALKATYKADGIDGVAAWLQAGIDRMPRTIAVVRIHDSGDFFSRWYAMAWAIVAGDNPGLLFYAYTKSGPILHGTGLHSLPNVRLTASEGGKFDHTYDHENGPVARIFESEDSRIAAGYVDGNDSDLPAILGFSHIGLVYHGSRNPSADEFKAVGGAL